MQICGVDDAGRGSLLGPLVIAGISATRYQIRKLSTMGVRDSKKLRPATRSKLYGEIIELVDDYCIEKITPKLIDKNVKHHNLNKLEAKYMARVISKLNPDISYVDSCDVNPKRFGKVISDLSHHKIRSYHHADDRFVLVSAASILAKVSRDRSIKRLQKIYNVGSGYPSDSKTIIFVNQYFKEYGVLPKFARASWKPAIKIVNGN